MKQRLTDLSYILVDIFEIVIEKSVRVDLIIVQGSRQLRLHRAHHPRNARSAVPRARSTLHGKKRNSLLVEGKISRPI